MSTQRVLKQMTYAGGCLGIVLIILFGLIALVARPKDSAQPTPTPPPSYQPIEIEQVDVINHGTTIDVVARLMNPNARTGFPDVPLTFTVLNGTGEEVVSQAVTTYLLPGSLQYAVALNLPISGQVGSVNVTMPDTLATMELPEAISVATFSTFLQERTSRLIGNQTVEEQKGIVTNTSSFDFQRVEVTAIAFDANGSLTGVGKTFLGELAVGEQREFTIQWPQPLTATERVLTLTSTNMFQEDNIIRVIGDPSQLR